MAAPRTATTQVVRPDSLLPGTLVDQYELIRSIGSGGMGEVFLARDTKLGRLVAVKVLHPSDPAAGQRILLEARATAKCTHENIVVIHDMNEFQGRPYLVLEYLEGMSLRKVSASGPLQLWRMLEIMASVLRALEHAHAMGIVHRDLKPDNIFVTQTGVVKVLDFGIAKFAGGPVLDGIASGSTHISGSHGDGETYVTISGQGMVGTWSYMSPEQFQTTNIDQRSDVWAVGMMMYRFAAGRHPYDGLDPGALMYATCAPDPIPSVGTLAPHLPRHLIQVIDAALQKNKDERFPSARAMLDALEPLLPRHSAQQVADERCPYPGLQSFQELDAERFFGRSAQISRAVGRLESQPLLAVIGPSGAGKSSFIRAGVIPALKRDGAWESVVVRPGRKPVHALAMALAPLTGHPETGVQQTIAQNLYEMPGYLGTLLRWRAGEIKGRVLLFVDQFEELYTLVPDPRERAAYVTMLHAAADDPASPVRVVLSLRSDFLDRVAEERVFMNAVTEGMHYLMPLGREGLRDALVRPTRTAGFNFENTDLAERMVSELALTPGALPLLQFAASRLWEGRDRARRLLTVAAYQAMGGVAGALATHADAVLAGMSREHRRLAQLVFVRLVTTEGTRAIVDLHELLAMAPDAQALVDQLVAARLLVMNVDERGGSRTVEVVHESLITAWPQLRQWMDAGREETSWIQSLRQAAQQWESRGRAEGLLWRGATVDEARRMHERVGSLAPRERAFLDAVFALANRANRRKRIAITATLVFLGALATVAVIVAFTVRAAERRAVDEATKAEVARQETADKLRVIEEKEAARLKAEAEAKTAAEAAAVAAQAATAAGADAELSRAELQKSNERLQAALAASERAKEESERARREVESLLASEKKRVQQLQDQRKKIATELK